MKYAYWGFALIMSGLFGLAFIVMFQDITINNESEYYVLKEAMEASMLESVDWVCYRAGDIDNDGKQDCGVNELKISEQKFVENFTRRYAASASGSVSSYTIEFYDIIEKPPKATVVIRGKTQNFSILSEDDEEVTFNITNDLSGILELYS